MYAPRGAWAVAPRGDNQILSVKSVQSCQTPVAVAGPASRRVPRPDPQPAVRSPLPARFPVDPPGECPESGHRAPAPETAPRAQAVAGTRLPFGDRAGPVPALG